MENDERQLLEDATKRLDEITTDVDEEELSEELGSIVSDLKTSVKSLEFSSGRSIAEEEADMAADKLHDCIIDYSEIWEENISKMDELEEEIIPDIERAVEELGQTNYEDYRNELDDQFGGVDISDDPDDKF